MKTTEQARELAELLVRLSEDLGIRASALITDMDHPLGSAIGNALEVHESIAFLRGDEVPEDLDREARQVAVRLLELSGISDPGNVVEEALTSGTAHEKFVEFVRAQGGDANALEALPVSDQVREVAASEGGYVARFGASGVGRAALALGAGREKKGDEVDPGAGVEMLVKVGDRIEKGEPVAHLYGGRNAGKAEALVREAPEISEDPVEPPPAVLDSL